jgi:antiviral helicase SKI2
MINKLNKKGNLPAIVFVFSKKSLNYLAEYSAENLNLVTSEERRKIATFFERSISKLKEHDREILQLLTLKNLLIRGIGIHHGDLLSICKEIVELLLENNLIKLLFATDSFAMGLNMPAKSVIFNTIRKHDGKSFRTLHNGEYTQMCGRAGRRGIDTEGSAFIFIPNKEEFPNVYDLKPMMDSKGEYLESKFKLNYQIIINSYSSDSFKAK